MMRIPTEHMRKFPQGKDCREDLKPEIMFLLLNKKKIYILGIFF